MDANNIPINELVGFMLALVRTASWMVISPPFNNRSLPRIVKIGTAAAISLPLAGKLPADQVTLETGALLTQVFMQMATGLMLGFLTHVLFSAVQSAGAMIDLFGGFTMTQAMDPMGNNQQSVFGRFYQLTAVTLLFVINGHLLLLKGFMTSFEVVPLDGMHFAGFQSLLLDAVSKMGLAAIEIAGPLLAAYFLAEVALGLLSKAAPQLQILQFGFPFKILLTLLLVGSAIPLLPGAIDSLINDVLRSGMRVLHFSSGGGEA